MFLALIDIIIDIVIFLVVLIVIGGVASFFVIRDLQKEYKIVFRINSKFEIELRKLVNLMFKFLQTPKLEPYNDVVIKQLPHEEKRNLLKIIDEAYQNIDQELEENKYIVETYENLIDLRRTRDSKVIVFNEKIALFPFNIYIKFMKFDTYDTFVEK